MERTYIGRQVDLDLFMSMLEKFIKEKDFEAIKGETAFGHQIFAEHSPHYKFNGCASISVEGRFDDFAVKLEPCKQKKSSFEPVLMNTMLFGGWFLRSRLKSEEEWVKFEKDFWAYSNRAVDQLTNTYKQKMSTT